MRDLLRTKFADPGMRRALELTGDALLVHGNSWRDHFWGECAGKGENWLGRLLMEVRAECDSRT